MNSLIDHIDCIVFFNYQKNKIIYNEENNDKKKLRKFKIKETKKNKKITDKNNDDDVFMNR